MVSLRGISRHVFGMKHSHSNYAPATMTARGAGGRCCRGGPAARAPTAGRCEAWWRGRHRKATQGRTATGWPHGRHRLADGDVVPINGRRWVDYLATRQLPIVSTVDRPLLTRIAELRAPRPGRRPA